MREKKIELDEVARRLVLLAAVVVADDYDVFGDLGGEESLKG